MEHRPKRSLIFLQLVRAVDIQTHINAVGSQTFADVRNKPAGAAASCTTSKVVMMSYCSGMPCDASC